MIFGLSIQEIIACLLMGAGLIFLIGSMVGMLRLPDYYSRVHASGNSETLGTLLVFLGLIVYNGYSNVSAKIFIVALFVFLGNPIGSHILAKAAYKTGHPVWTQKQAVQHELSTEPTTSVTTEEEKEAQANADLHN
ncbi:monovalent cation/H(+) antiporter subunit G [Schwartzia sp. (in: firmicutes)]|nr:monovalent cation/H(+) antiporter subunit G [Schwartzia sp. (in: firmicutes)]